MGREIVACAKEFHILHQHGTPGVHASNGVIERANREVLDRARIVLDQAGFPVCFWPCLLYTSPSPRDA
eukprot:6561249-Lingulodinium_polyedra.AAC.1